MCVIVYKKVDVQMPKKKVLKTCWKNNEDGAGYAWFDETEETWCVKKGFETWKSFWASFNKNRFTEKDHLIIHFRIGTSGKKGGGGYRDFSHPDCTHPFPISDKDEDLFSLEYCCKSIIAHNGVHGSGVDDLSDSMLAVKHLVSVLYLYIDDPRVAGLLEELLKPSTNRWIFTEGNKVTLIGNWITDKDTSILYSKDSYKEKPKSSTTYWNNNNNGVYGCSYGYGWKQTYKKEDIDIEFLSVHRTMFYKKGEWDWKIFDFIMEENSKKEKIKSEKEEVIEATEIYDFKDNVIATVYSDGVVSWEDTTTTTKDRDILYHPIEEVNDLIIELGEDHEFPCVDCGQTMLLDDVNCDGSCPWCETILFPQKQEEDHGVECPLCKSDIYVINWQDTWYECVSCQEFFQHYYVDGGKSNESSS